MDYAAEAQYLLPLYHATGLTDQRYKNGKDDGLPEYRPATTYSWKDSNAKTCPFDRVTYEGFCQVMEQLAIKRIFFLGDEVTQEQAMSLYMLMKLPVLLSVDDDESFERTVQCTGGAGGGSGGSDYSFQIVFLRNDELLETPIPMSLKDGKGNCCRQRKGFCRRWFKEYSTFDAGRSVVIANTGLHMTTAMEYQTAIKRFIQEIQGFHKDEDILMLRTSVPGHPSCQQPDMKPYGSVLNFDSTRYGAIVPSYNLGTQAGFNHILLTQATNKQIHILDIFPMTVMRPDGHLSEDTRADGLPHNDCIRYSLPGPIDWWNHLLYSNLKDMANTNANTTLLEAGDIRV